MAEPGLWILAVLVVLAIVLAPLLPIGNFFRLVPKEGILTIPGGGVLPIPVPAGTEPALPRAPGGRKRGEVVFSAMAETGRKSALPSP